MLTQITHSSHLTIICVSYSQIHQLDKFKAYSHLWCRETKSRSTQEPLRSSDAAWDVGH